MLEEAANTTTPTLEGAQPNQSQTTATTSTMTMTPNAASDSVSTRQSNPPKPTPRGSHNSTKAAISLCLHPADKSVVFSRTPDPDEFDDDFEIELLQRELCE